MSGQGHGRRCRQPRHRSKVEKLRRQVKLELREANTGAFSKKSACIRLLPHQPIANIFGTV